MNQKKIISNTNLEEIRLAVFDTRRQGYLLSQPTSSLFYCSLMLVCIHAVIAAPTTTTTETPHSDNDKKTLAPLLGLYLICRAVATIFYWIISDSRHDENTFIKGCCLEIMIACNIIARTFNYIAKCTNAIGTSICNPLRTARVAPESPRNPQPRENSEEFINVEPRENSEEFINVEPRGTRHINHLPMYEPPAPSYDGYNHTPEGSPPPSEDESTMSERNNPPEYTVENQSPVQTSENANEENRLPPVRLPHRPRGLS